MKTYGSLSLGLSLLFSMAQTSQVNAAEGRAASADAGEMLVYFGTYTGGKSKGIYVSRFDIATGKLGTPELAGEVASPSFLALHPNQKYLYAVNEVGNYGGKKTGAVAAFSVDQQSGKLTLLNQQPSGGDGPCHLIVDRTGQAVLVANYGGGSCAVFPIESGGGLGKASAFKQHVGSSVNKRRQEKPHAHGIYVDSENRFAFVPDLGLDRVMSYRFDPTQGTLTPNDPPFASVAPGSGPRHFAFHPSSKHAYVINEMTCTITAFSYDATKGALSEIQSISTLPKDQPVLASYSTAELEVHPDGKFLYGSNRGHDTIAVFAIDPQSGKLSLVQHESTQGKIPRSFAIDPTGTFLLAANQNSDTVVPFRIDPQSGRLTATGDKIEVGSPVCVTYLRLRK